MNWKQEILGYHETVPKFLHQRKNMALMFIAGQGNLSAARALAMFETGKGITQTAKECIQCSIDAVRSGDDCAGIHLALLLLYLHHQYRHHIMDSQTGQIRDALLGFCYRREEPEDDSMRYFGEKPSLLFHVGQYLAGCMFEQESFTAEGLKGAQQRETGKEHLNKWFDRFLQSGYAEFCSTGHILDNMTGFFALYLMAPDENVRHLSKHGLDKTFRVIGYNQFYGVISSCYYRASQETFNGPELLELSFLFWIAAGSGYMAASSYVATLFALSSYEPPAWEKDVQVGRFQYAAVEWDLGTARAKTYAYRTGSYALSCVRRFKPSFLGHKPHLMHAFMGTRAAPFHINHPGERLLGERGCPSCPAGNGTIVLIEQYKALQMMVFRLGPEELPHGISACAPSSLYDEISIDGNWFFARTEDAYLAVRFSSPFQLTVSKENAMKELKSQGPYHAVIVRMGSEAEFLSFANFVQCMHKAEFSWSGQDGVAFRDPEYGLLCMRLNGQTTLVGQELPCEDAPEPVVEVGFLGREQSCAGPEKGGEAGPPKQKMIIFMDSGDTLIDEGTEVRDVSGIVYHAELFPGAGEALRTLYDQGHTIALVADGETQSFVNIYNENGLGDCFHVRVISEEVGEQKPARSMFQTAFNALNLCDDDKHRIVMVGNNIFKDITGANRFGIHSILINRSARYIMAPSSFEQEADFVIRGPFELPGIIAWMEDHLL